MAWRASLGSAGFKIFAADMKSSSVVGWLAGCAEEKFVELALAEIGQQRGEVLDGGFSRQGSGGTGFLGQAFDALEKFGLFVANGADFSEKFEFGFLVFVFAGDGLFGVPLGEQVVRDDFLAFGQQAGIRAEHLDEGVDFRLGSFAELDEVVALVGREKVVGVNLVELGVHAVDAPDALNEARGIPRNVVIDDDIGAVEVHAFGENFGGDQDAVIVLGAICLGVEIGDDILADAVERFAGEEQDFGFNFVADFRSEIVGGFLGLGEDDELAGFE